MKNNQGKFIAAFILIAVLCLTLAEGKGKMSNNKFIYRISLVKNTSKSIAVKQDGKNLTFNLEGFASPITLKVTGGGVETCRTILEHKSDRATIILSLPIPTPNMPCQMTVGFISVNSQTFKISLTEEEVKKVIGNDIQLRKLVEKSFGKI